MAFLGQNQGVSGAVFLLEILGKNLFLDFCSFKRPPACLGSCPLPPLPKPAVQHLQSSLCFLLLSPTLTLLPPSYIYPCDSIQLIWIIKDTLPIATALTSSYLRSSFHHAR